MLMTDLWGVEFFAFGSEREQVFEDSIVISPMLLGY